MRDGWRTRGGFKITGRGNLALFIPAVLLAQERPRTPVCGAWTVRGGHWVIPRSKTRPAGMFGAPALGRGGDPCRGDRAKRMLQVKG